MGTVVGMGRSRQLPAFFELAMQMPITVLRTPEFAFKNNRSVDLLATVAFTIRSAPEYWRSLQALKARVADLQPDVILNFFEPLTGIYALTTRRRPPVVAIGHQFMFEHPHYIRAPGLRLEQWGMKWFVRLVGSASTRMALSFYEAADIPQRSLFVCPPILRRSLFELQPNPNGDFVLVYLLNHGYEDQIIKWHRANRSVSLHCFYDKPGAPAEDRRNATLTFHRLDGQKFLRMMANCKYVVCTAGFESVSEAAYLGKPLFMVPVENHVEQQINAVDAVRCGFGETDKTFNLDRLKELPARLSNGEFRDWLKEAHAVLLRVIQHATDDLRSASSERNVAARDADRAAAQIPAPQPE
jgi:uncharacterized protein (TIGR00661 family)